MITRITFAKYHMNDYSNVGQYKEGSIELAETTAWYGQGAKELELSGQVDLDTYSKIRDGHVPNSDQKLNSLNIAGHEYHDWGIEITLSAPKSVSLAASIGGDQRVIDAHHNAVEQTLNYVEKEFLEVRERGPDDKKIAGTSNNYSEKMVAAIFSHEANKQLDPQLHTQAVLMNMVQAEDGKWREMEFKEVYNNSKLINTYYHNELAANLKDIGYGIKMAGENDIFEVTKGSGALIYSQEVLDGFSTSAGELQKNKEGKYDLMGLDISDPVLKQQSELIASAKEGIDREALHEHWQEKAESLGIDVDKNKNLVASIGDSETASATRAVSTLEAVDWAVRHLEERNSVFSKSDVLAVSMIRDPGSNSVSDIEKAMETLTSEGRLIGLENKDGLTTDKAFQAEYEKITSFEATQNVSKEATLNFLTNQQDRTFATIVENLEYINEAMSDDFKGTREGLAKHVARDWMNHVHHPDTAYRNTGIIASSNVLQEEITANIREELSKLDILHGESVQIDRLTPTGYTEAEREIPSNYKEGQIVVFADDIPSLEIKAGDALTVDRVRSDSIEFKQDGDVISIDLTDDGMAKNLDVYNVSEMELRAGDEIRWTRNDSELNLVASEKAEIVAVSEEGVRFITEDGRDFLTPLDDPALQHSVYAFEAIIDPDRQPVPEYSFNEPNRETAVGEILVEHEKIEQSAIFDHVLVVMDENHLDLSNQKEFFEGLAQPDDLIFVGNERFLDDTLYTNSDGETILSFRMERDFLLWGPSEDPRYDPYLGEIIKDFDEPSHDYLREAPLPISPEYSLTLSESDKDSIEPSSTTSEHPSLEESDRDEPVIELEHDHEMEL